jgi:hypothetical protein
MVFVLETDKKRKLNGYKFNCLWGSLVSICLKMGYTMGIKKGDDFL